MSKKERIKALTQEIDSLEMKIAAKQSDYAQKSSICTTYWSMNDAKKRGNVLLIIGLLLIPAEILAVLFVSSFQMVDLLIIGAFLIPGIVRKVSGMREYKAYSKTLAGVDIDLVRQQTRELKQELDSLKETLQGKEVEQDELKICGNWDYKNLYAFDSHTMDELEADFIDLAALIGSWEIEDSEIIGNWLTIAIAQNVTATVSKDTALIAKFNAVDDKLRDTGRWPLAFLPLFILTGCVNVLNEVWNMGQPTTLSDALKSAKFPAPNDKYADFYANCIVALERIVDQIVKEVKKHS